MHSQPSSATWHLVFTLSLPHKWRHTTKRFHRIQCRNEGPLRCPLNPCEDILEMMFGIQIPVFTPDKHWICAVTLPTGSLSLFQKGPFTSTVVLCISAFYGQYVRKCNTHCTAWPGPRLEVKTTIFAIGWNIFKIYFWLPDPGSPNVWFCIFTLLTAFLSPIDLIPVFNFQICAPFPVVLPTALSPKILHWSDNIL